MSTTTDHFERDVEGQVDGTTASGEQQASGDFFSMFYLPSSQTYGEDVHLSSLVENNDVSASSQTSTYIPFQGAAAAASAMMGGILSAIDTAIAVMNEEFDSSDSIISDETTKEDAAASKSSKDNDKRYYKQTAESKSSSARDGTKDSLPLENASDNSEHSSNNNTVHNMITDATLERIGSQDIDYTPQHSLIGSISTLQLFEEGTKLYEESMKLLRSDDQHSDAKKDTERKDKVEPEISKKEDSDYFIIRNNERVTNDGWLVVSED